MPTTKRVTRYFSPCCNAEMDYDDHLHGHCPLCHEPCVPEHDAEEADDDGPLITSGLFFTDNGCVLCAAHLGASARYTGRDLSGQRIERVTAQDHADAEAMGLRLACETCGGRGDA